MGWSGRIRRTSLWKQGFTLERGMRMCHILPLVLVHWNCGFFCLFVFLELEVCHLVNKGGKPHKSTGEKKKEKKK